MTGELKYHQSQKSILLIDDDQRFRQATKQVLVKLPSVRPYETPDAIIGLSMSRNQKFDIILVDLQMRGMTGDKFIEYIRSGKNGHLNIATPILLVTGPPDMELIKGLSGKISSVLLKPFDAETLLKKIAPLIYKQPNMALMAN